jgi:NTP pyrophosphatase (non-canonical NTP hydrolase)
MKERAERLRLEKINVQLSENLRAFQARCTELLLENRKLRSEKIKQRSNAFDIYQQTSTRTINSDHNWSENLSNFGLGLAGEAGEVIEPIKKHLFHGRYLDRDKLAIELGDALWYIAAIATTIGRSLSSIADGNVKKLEERYPKSK